MTHLALKTGRRGSNLGTRFRLAEDIVSAVAGTPVRPGRRNGPGRSSGATSSSGAVLTGHASSLLEEITGYSRETSGTPVNLRGVFYHDSRGVSTAAEASDGMAATSSEQPAHRQAFKQRLDMLLATEESARAVARKLYPHFEGDTSKLPALLQLLEDRWGFPERVFPLLWTNLQRITGYTDDLPHVDEDEWAEAFLRWLQVVRTRCERTKMSRQCFVQTQSGADRAKVYLQGAKLGEGSYGEVHMAFHRELAVGRVVKSVPKAQLGLAEEQVEDEVNALKSLDHPHIVRIFEAFETEEKLHIVMDFAEGGDLASAIRQSQDQNIRLPEVWSREVTVQITSALEYMHSKGMIHCDLKPGNTMLLRPFTLKEAESPDSKPHVLLVDFGLAEIFDERPLGGGPTQVKGTPSYLAPEGFEGRVNYKSDMWALGVMMYEMLKGERPFRGCSSVFMLFCQVQSQEPPMDGISDSAKDLLCHLLAKDAKGRPSATECRTHGWFTEQPSPWKRRCTGCQLCVLGHATYFHRAVTFCIASALGMQEIGDFVEIFQVMDTDNSGYIQLDELAGGLGLLGSQQETKDPSALLQILDLDGDKKVSITEWLAGTLQLKEGTSDKQLRYAFTLFDHDCDDFLGMEDLRLLLSGDGPQADVLPDGKTVEQVMDEVSGGSGRISFADFQSYLTRAYTPYVPAAMASNGFEADDAGVNVSALVHDLPTPLMANQKSDGAKESAESLVAEFPSFHAWLKKLFEDTQQGASFSHLLVFADKTLEAAYVAHYIGSTCMQIFLLALCLLIYSLWSLTTEDAEWNPSIAAWEPAPKTANNLAWIFLAASAVAVMFACGFSVRARAAADAKGQDDGGRDLEAVRLEKCLCVWACLVQWVGCFFANRFRVATLFGTNADEVFQQTNSDYDLIVTMIGMLMFFSTRTHTRFICMLPLAISCVLAYIITSVWLGVQDSSCVKEKNNAWPAILLTIVSVLCLSGHRAVEYHRRLSFCSLYASYSVLREMNSDDLPRDSDGSGGGGNANSPVTPGMTGSEPRTSSESRSARLKRALDLVRRLSDSGELLSRPLKAALQSVAEVLQSTRADLADIDRLLDRLLVMDIEAKLQQARIAESAQDLLLPLFDALPPTERPVEPLPRTRSLQLPDVGGWEAVSGDLEAAKAWGWDTLTDTVASGPSRPLAIAGGALLLPTVATAAARVSGGPEAVEIARTQARNFLEEMLRGYSQGSSRAEARAALALQVSHWLAHRLGLWELLAPWERVALLVASLGLYAGGREERGGTLTGRDPLLTHAWGIEVTLNALERSGLGDAEGGLLCCLVRRLLARTRPRCVLEDVYRLRAHFERDDQVPAAPAERAAFTSLVLAAADLAFLALPVSQHRQWASLCQLEAAEALDETLLVLRNESALELDVAAWLRGLVEVLAIPVYQTLGLLVGAEAHLAAPLRNLREHAKYWKTAKLVATPGIDVGKEQTSVHITSYTDDPGSDTSGVLTIVGGNAAEQTVRTLSVVDEHGQDESSRNLADLFQDNSTVAGTIVGNNAGSWPANGLSSMSQARGVDLGLSGSNVRTLPLDSAALGTLDLGSLMQQHTLPWTGDATSKEEPEAATLTWSRKESLEIGPGNSPGCVRSSPVAYGAVEVESRPKTLPADGRSEVAHGGANGTETPQSRRLCASVPPGTKLPGQVSHESDFQCTVEEMWC